MNYIFYLRTAALDASAAPFIFTSATAETGNSRILSDEIPRSSRGMTQGLEILEFALGILEFSVILGLDPRISVLGNSRILSDEILESSREMTQGLGNF